MAVKNTLNLRLIENVYYTRNVSNKMLARHPIRTSTYGLMSIRYQSVLNWNDLQHHFKDIDLSSVVPSRIKTLNQIYLSKNN